MVTGIHYYATDSDQNALLDYLGVPNTATLHPWPVLDEPLQHLTRVDALTRSHVMVVSSALGPPVSDLATDRATFTSARSQVFNHLNRERLNLAPTDALIDSDVSPVLLWKPATAAGRVLHIGDIGSQAESMEAVSADFARWVNRVMGWIRPRGTRVWGLERHALRPDLDVSMSIVSSVYALPDALLQLENGAQGRG